MGYDQEEGWLEKEDVKVNIEGYCESLMVV